MPRKLATTQKVTRLAIADPSPVPPAYKELDYADRLELAGLFSRPVFVQAWRNAEAFHPSCFPPGLDGALGNQIATNRLHELRGWELFRSALLRQAQDPVRLREPLKENFDDPDLRGPA